MFLHFRMKSTFLPYRFRGLFTNQHRAALQTPQIRPSCDRNVVLFEDRDDLQTWFFFDLLRGFWE
ncbi:hypothetical protein SEA_LEEROYJENKINS_120 [Microbacterium phage LeeroyJenkins]|nr:hypothetical protein SEA_LEEROYJENKINS_120 [Microbacterium phage LeeroyJenkins]